MQGHYFIKFFVIGKEIFWRTDEGQGFLKFPSRSLDILLNH